MRYELLHQCPMWLPLLLCSFRLMCIMLHHITPAKYEAGLMLLGREKQIFELNHVSFTVLIDFL
jgi:hypothetical protein